MDTPGFELNKKNLSVVGIISLAFLFYWYEVRPVSIRQACEDDAKNITIKSSVRTRTAAENINISKEKEEEVVSEIARRIEEEFPGIFYTSEDFKEIFNTCIDTRL